MRHAMGREPVQFSQGPGNVGGGVPAASCDQGFLVMLTVLVLNLIGEAVNDALNPRWPTGERRMAGMVT